MNPAEVETLGPRRARVEIIPLIDVIFFLLATFVLFTLSLQRVRILEAELPKAADRGGVDEQTAFVQASADGTFHWRIGMGGVTETITAQELGPRLQHYTRLVHAPRVLVRSDGQAKLRAAVLVLDEARRAGIKDVAIETRTAPTGG
jgi:biopolymer transport protein ExbD